MNKEWGLPIEKLHMSIYISYTMFIYNTKTFQSYILGFIHKKSIDTTFCKLLHTHPFRIHVLWHIYTDYRLSNMGILKLEDFIYILNTHIGQQGIANQL